jgi:acetyl-CoA synthetase
MLAKSDSYRELYDNFQWQIPETYNIASDICDKWATGTHRRALVFETYDGRTEEYSFDDVRRESNKLANVLASKGITTGDRVAVLLPQHPMVAFAHLAAYRLGAIAVPLFTLFGPDALAFRLKDSGAKLIVTDSVGVQTLSTIRDSLPDLLHVLTVDSHGGSDSSSIDTLMDAASDSFETKRTYADDPALII